MSLFLTFKKRILNWIFLCYFKQNCFLYTADVFRIRVLDRVGGLRQGDRRSRPGDVARLVVRHVEHEVVHADHRHPRDVLRREARIGSQSFEWVSFYLSSCLVSDFGEFWFSVGSFEWAFLSLRSRETFTDLFPFKVSF